MGETRSDLVGTERGGGYVLNPMSEMIEETIRRKDWKMP